MKVIILTAIPFWHPGTRELLDELKAKEFDVEAIDIFSGLKFTKNGKIISMIKLPALFRRIYLKLFRKLFVKKHLPKEALIDIHFVEAYYSKYLLQLPNNLICTFFGSDLFRTSKQQQDMQRPLLQKAKAIVLSENMVKEFNRIFPNLESKIHFNQYGSRRIDQIFERKANPSKNFDNRKINVCVGYNAKSEQQHSKIIDALVKKESILSEKIQLIFPMTYGGKEHYAKEIKNKLDGTSFDYILETNRLSDSEICELWESVDICINMQTTDALASSIKESLTARNVMLIADWLPYDIYKEMGIKFIQVDFNNIVDKLENVLENLDLHFEETSGNPKIIHRFASWKSLADDWAIMYRQLSSNG